MRRGGAFLKGKVVLVLRVGRSCGVEVSWAILGSALALRA
jgi:hypothetical protein